MWSVSVCVNAFDRCHFYLRPERLSRPVINCLSKEHLCVLCTLVHVHYNVVTLKYLQLATSCSFACESFVLGIVSNVAVINLVALM